MKYLLLLPLIILLSSASWRTDFEKSKSDARSDHKLILLKFSGSDWCLPCIRMEKAVFSNDSFRQFAERHLEMVSALLEALFASGFSSPSSNFIIKRTHLSLSLASSSA